MKLLIPNGQSVRQSFRVLKRCGIRVSMGPLDPLDHLHPRSMRETLRVHDDMRPRRRGR